MGRVLIILQSSLSCKGRGSLWKLFLISFMENIIKYYTKIDAYE